MADVCIAGFFLAAHVASEVTLLITGDTTRSSSWLWIGLAIFGPIAFARALPPGPVTDVWNATPLLLVCALPIVWYLGVLLEFVVAFAVSPAILFWIDVADRRGIVRYDVSRIHFTVSRQSTYAVLRALSRLCVVRFDLPVNSLSLVPFALSSLETIGMIFLTKKSYEFRNQLDFARYASLKASIFIITPIIEGALLHKYQSRD